GAVHMGMSVDGGGSAVGRPPRVPDAGGPDRRVAVEEPGQRADLACLLVDLEAVAVDHRHPGRVVAPVLQPPQPTHQHGIGLFFSGVADDAAHRAVLLPAWPRVRTRLYRLEEGPTSPPVCPRARSRVLSATLRPLACGG